MVWESRYIKKKEIWIRDTSKITIAGEDSPKWQNPNPEKKPTPNQSKHTIFVVSVGLHRPEHIMLGTKYGIEWKRKIGATILAAE